ncbi:hypothetical protein C9374_007861 [Naegleria lovaniensis]|uniref:Peptidase S9 prolyl oligopeptidase catalytic domain-containing protein n=1 Tax=Naegleria lovaniensis TaxID=51637 RepID=A0AA88GM32_NAELO|nr:uncharacterized protein C9374_007861 [Naegleria lovaniensis]KAG2378713.1 hypothetical protein C9374_007861 [Naegleria lovaniensis]
MFFSNGYLNTLTILPLLLIGIHYPFKKLLSFLAFYPPPTPKAQFSTFQKLLLRDSSNSSKRTIPFYFLQALDSKVKTTILLSHGNGTNIVEMLQYAEFLRRTLNVNVLHYEYFGYDQWQKPSEGDVYASAEAAFDYLVKEQKIDPSDIYVFGISIGSGPSCHLAHKYQNIGGLILQTPLLSILQVGLGKTFMKPLLPLLRPYDMFCNNYKIPSIKAPVLIVHGTEDSIVPYSHGVELFERAQNKFKIVTVPNANHNDIFNYLHPSEYNQHLMEFIEQTKNNVAMTMDSARRNL